MIYLKEFNLLNEEENNLLLGNKELMLKIDILVTYFPKEVWKKLNLIQLPLFMVVMVRENLQL